jgi:hypothetical protein
MDEDRSYILVHDIILHPQKNTTLPARSDVLVMAAPDPKERAEKIRKHLAE